MLKAILRSIRAMLAALPRFAVERIWDGMRWVQRLVAMPSPAYEPDFEPTGTATDSGDSGYINAIRVAAAHLAAGQQPTAEAAEHLRPVDVEWLTALPRPMLCRVATASDQALAAHIRRTAQIKGVLVADEVAVREYTSALSRERMQQIEDKEMALAMA